MRNLIAVLILGLGFFAVSRFVIVPLGEPSSVWLWCDMLSTCGSR